MLKNAPGSNLSIPSISKKSKTILDFSLSFFLTLNFRINLKKFYFKKDPIDDWEFQHNSKKNKSFWSKSGL